MHLSCGYSLHSTWSIFSKEWAQTIVELISVAAFSNCNRIVLLIFFPITLRNLPSEYISLAVVTRDPFKTYGAMCLYTSLYFIAIGQEITRTFPRSIRYPLFCATNTLLDFTSSHSGDILFGACAQVHQ